MKKTFCSFLILIICALAFAASAQTTNVPRFRTTVTLTSSNIAAHALLQSVTNRVLEMTAPSTGTNLFRNVNAGIGSAWIASNTTPASIVATNAGLTAMMIVSNMVPVSSNFRFRMRIRTDAVGFKGGNGIVLGFWTNGLPTDNTGLLGWQMADGQGTGGSGFALHHIAGISFGPASDAWGSTQWTNNATYDFCGSGDGTNLNMTISGPGHSNEVWMCTPIASLATGITLTNFGVEWFGTNGLLTSLGIRWSTNNSGGTELFSQGSSVDSTCDFIVYSLKGAAGVTVRIQVPRNYDARTNVPGMIVNGHGNTGAARQSTFGYLDENGIPAIRNYWNYVCSNANCIIVGCDWSDLDATGRKDSWGASNANYTINSAINYVLQRWAVSNIFLWGESAGGATVENYASSHIRKIDGIIFNHAICSSSNSYADGVNRSDMDFTFGGSSAAQLATVTNASGWLSGDCFGIATRTGLVGIPMQAQYSYGDTVVLPARHTDLLGIAFGATPPTSNALPTYVIYTNLPMTPEFSYYGVNGAGGGHGYKCYGLDVATNTVNFINRCRIYATNKFVAAPLLRPAPSSTLNTNAPRFRTP